MSLYKHQQDGVQFINENSNCALYWEMGCGKTRTVLEGFDRTTKLLVIAPLSILEQAWGQDVKKFTSLTYCNLHDEPFKESDIYLINFESAEKKCPKDLSNFTICVDESSKMKSHSTKITKFLLTLKPKHKIIMSGTPAPNNASEYWAQGEFLTPNTFGKYHAFIGRYFQLKRGNQTCPAYNVGQFLQKGWKLHCPDLTPIVSRIPASWLTKKECLDLPEQVDIIRSITLNPAERKAYKDMETDLLVEIEEESIPAQIALVKLMKLRELTSSFVYDENGKPHTTGSSKIQELKQILSEVSSAVIWINFEYERKIINEIVGPNSIDSFVAGACRYLVVHPLNAAHGLTFTNTSTQVFFSLSYSNEQYSQARARTHRIGQKNTCTYIHLVAKDSIDEQIMEVLKMKGDFVEYARNCTKNKSLKVA